MLQQISESDVICDGARMPSGPLNEIQQVGAVRVSSILFDKNLSYTPRVTMPSSDQLVPR
jgi:hypothetical protein